MTTVNTENMSGAEIGELARVLASKAEEKRAAERRAEREARRNKDAAERAEHADRMFTEIGQPLAGLNEAQHSEVYSVAWEHGHSSGFGDVEIYYGDFAELARKVIAAS
jgi:hypothetical protein